MRRFLWAAIVVLAVAAAAWADGVVLPGRAVLAPVRTPDQRALLAFDGRQETLVIETTLAGEGRDFAWIVPLPAAPKVEESTSGLFPSLEVMCGPSVDDHDNYAWLAVAWIGLLLVGGILAGNRRLPVVALIIALLLTAGLVGTVAAIVPTMQARETGSAGAVRVISRESVGAFDSAVLAATDAKALHAWLDANGYRAPADIDAVVDDYAAKGWAFVASKIRRDTEDGVVRAVRPLAFTFPATKAVYPIRLTGVVNDTCALELFVFGASSAAADGFDVEYSRPDIKYSIDDVHCHREIARRAAGADCVTKLVGTLDRERMRDDVAVRWTPAASQHATYLGPVAARSIAGACGLFAFFAILVVGSVRTNRSPGLRRVATALGVGFIVAGIAWALMPRLPSGGRRIGRADAWAPTAGLRAAHEPFTDVATARAWAAKVVAGRENPFTGGPVREEDSPGNYVVREIDGLVEVVIYDFHSHEFAPDENCFNLTSDCPDDRSTIRSPRQFTLRGVVFDSAGQPVAKAQVVVDRNEPHREGIGVHFSWNALETVTDSQGRFVVASVPDELSNVAAFHSQHGLAVLNCMDPRKFDGVPLAIRLPRCTSLRGRVIDLEGRPVSGVYVGAEPDIRNRFHAGPANNTLTAADGTFDLAVLPADSGPFTVWVYPHKGDSRCVTFDIAAGQSSAELRVDPR